LVILLLMPPVPGTFGEALSLSLEASQYPSFSAQSSD